MQPAEIAIPLAVAFGVSTLVTPVVAAGARRFGIVDRPSDRSVNRRENVPLAGGLAVACGFMAGLGTALWLISPVSPPIHLIGLIVGSGVLLACGIVDDRFGLAAWPKFAVQLAAAAIAIAAGFQMGHITEPISRTTIFFSEPVAWIATAVWIVGVTNAINLIDGLDGLATGVGAIICITLTVIMAQAGEPFGLCLGVALLGGLLGFLPHNFPPARIFLGDTGSMFIGYSLALLSLEGYRQINVVTFVVPLLALAVPILDVALSILRRLRLGQPVFSADRLHMHHRLLDLRGTPRRAVIQFYFLTACFSLISVSFTDLQGTVAAVCLLFVFILTVRLLWNLGLLSVNAHDDMDGAAPEKENTT